MSKPRVYEFIEPKSKEDPTPLYIRLNEEEILDEYWDHWVSQVKKVGREHLISKERCIQDWVTVHWAYEVTNETN